MRSYGHVIAMGPAIIVLCIGLFLLLGCASPGPSCFENDRQFKCQEW